MSRRPTVPLDAEEQAMARRLAALPDALPAPALDARIRAQAHAAVRRRPLRLWGGALAAALALGVGLDVSRSPDMRAELYPVDDSTLPAVEPKSAAPDASAPPAPVEMTPSRPSEPQPELAVAAERQSETAATAAGDARPTTTLLDQQPTRPTPFVSAPAAPPSVSEPRPAAPPVAPAAPPPAPIEELTVTGSRLKRPDAPSPSPAPQAFPRSVDTRPAAPAAPPAMRAPEPPAAASKRAVQAESEHAVRAEEGAPASGFAADAPRTDSTEAEHVVGGKRRMAATSLEQLIAQSREAHTSEREAELDRLLREIVARFPDAELPADLQRWIAERNIAR